MTLLRAKPGGAAFGTKIFYGRKCAGNQLLSLCLCNCMPVDQRGCVVIVQSAVLVGVAFPPIDRTHSTTHYNEVPK